MAVIIPSGLYRSPQGMMALLGGDGQLTLARFGWDGGRCLLRLAGVDICLTPADLRTLGKLCIEHSERDIPDEEIDLD